MTKILPFLLLLVSCAVVEHPQGGEKDETPPLATLIEPDSNTTNFQGSEILIHFDEYFEIKDPNAILISPPPVKAPDIDIIKHNLRIKFKAPLQTNATYTVQLFDGIQDINEKNVLPALQFSFSTGNQIDTLSFSGLVLNNYTNEPQKAFTVALFHPNILDYPDSVLFPLYITKTLENGSFKIPSIPDSLYTIYAFKDINNNNIPDLGEDMGYLDHKQRPNDSVKIRTGQNILNRPLIYSSPQGISENTFILPVKIPNSYFFSIQSKTKSKDKTQRLFTKFIHSDTLLIQDFIKESSDTLATYYLMNKDSITDTITVQFPIKANSTQLNPNRTNTLAPNDTFFIQSINSLLTYRPGFIQLFKNDSIPVSSLKITMLSYSIGIRADLEHETDYTLIFPDSAVVFFDRQLSHSDTIHFKTSTSNAFGNAAVLYSNSAKQLYRIELLKDLSKEPEYFIYSTEDSCYFSNITPGTYNVRLIKIDSLKQPDQLIPFKRNVSKVYVNPTKLTIRGGWTIGDFLLNNKED
ncbi:MAG: hypothetical protein GC180_10870 [Bacteroidetes bacterium]|nr:hypothetical protein [Bacteroidota bacterium]